MHEFEIINVGDQLHESLKDQARELVKCIDDRLTEINRELAKAKKLEIEKEQLLKQRDHLNQVIDVKPEPKKAARKLKKNKQADVMFDILSEAYPRSLHWKGIYEKLKQMGIGHDWKLPSASILSVLSRDERFMCEKRGCWTLRKDAVNRESSLSDCQAYVANGRPQE